MRSRRSRARCPPADADPEARRAPGGRRGSARVVGRSSRAIGLPILAEAGRRWRSTAPGSSGRRPRTSGPAVRRRPRCRRRSSAFSSTRKAGVERLVKQVAGEDQLEGLLGTSRHPVHCPINCPRADVGGAQHERRELRQRRVEAVRELGDARDGARVGAEAKPHPAGQRDRRRAQGMTVRRLGDRVELARRSRQAAAPGSCGPGTLETERANSRGPDATPEASRYSGLMCERLWKKE